MDSMQTLLSREMVLDSQTPSISIPRITTFTDEASVDDSVDELLENSPMEPEADDFNMTDVLPQYITKTRTTKELHGLIHEGQIDLDPPYQRDVVWSSAKQSQLIDSIFRNYYIPPVIFSIREQDGDELWVSVDGKQRLSSIQKFFDGQIPHVDARTRKKWWYTFSETQKASHQEVPQRWKDEFCSKKIVCAEFRNLTPAQETDLFQRVQLGVALTAAEKLQAYDSPWSRWISKLEQRHVTVDDGLSQKLDWDITRGKSFQGLAQLIYACENFALRPTITADKLAKWLNQEDPPTPEFKKTIETVLETFWQIAATDKYNKGFTTIKKKVAPIEFVFIGALLYILREYSVKVKANAVYLLRYGVRHQFKDVRANSNVSNAMWDIIGIIEENPEEVDIDDVIPGKGRKPKPKPSPVKRQKRAKDEDSDDGEFTVTPKRLHSSASSKR